MDGKDKLDELLVSYLLNELDAQEDALVIEWLNSDEQNRLYLEELKRVLNLVQLGQTLEKVNVESEWNRFDNARKGIEQKPLISNEAERFGNEIIKEVGLKRKTTLYKTIAFTAIAACIILAIGLGWSLMSRETPALQTVAQHDKEEEKQSLAVPTPVIKNLVNNTDKIKEYELEDGTIVLLSAKSELTFPEPFESDKRDVQLRGKAEFNVAKNELKPFTVFSGDIATTALGTRFTVSAYKNSTNYYVRLFEGKVMVKSIVQSQFNKKAYYLVPGQELVYNKPKKKTNIWIFTSTHLPEQSGDVSESSTSVATDDPSIPKYGKGSWYMFNNQPLNEVLDQLGDMYNVEIHYSEKDISKMYFIGTFSKSDSLETVLKQITSLNRLKLIRENNKYSIKK